MEGRDRGLFSALRQKCSRAIKLALHLGTGPDAKAGPFKYECALPATTRRRPRQLIYRFHH